MASGGQRRVGYSLVNVGTVKLEDINRDPFYEPFFRDIVLSRDVIVTIDYYGCKVQLHRLNDGKLLGRSSKLESHPNAVCVMTEIEICIILDNGLITILSIDSTDMSRGLITTRNLHVRGVLDVCHGVARFKDTLVVSGIKQDTISWCNVSLDDGHVNIVHQICKAFDGGSYSSVTTKDNKVYISCDAGDKSPDNGVYGYDILNPNQYKYIYKHQDLDFPSGITINQDGFIFVCNFGGDDDCIHQLTDTCQLVSIFRVGITCLYGIFCELGNGHLYVTRCRSNIITIFRTEDQGGHDASELLMCEERQHHAIEEKAKHVEHRSHDTVPVQSSYAPIGKLGEKNIAKESIAESTLEFTTAGFVPEKGEKVLNMLRKDDYKGIEAVLAEHKIPTKLTTITAVKECGYKESVKFLLRRVSDLLKEAIPNSTAVWCGYRQQDPNCPVFVVTLNDRNCIYEIPKQFSEYEIIVRHKHLPNKEERSILKMMGRKRVRAEDASNIKKCFADNSDKLMREHSNLSIITSSPVKASGYLNNKLVLTEKTCVVFIVPVKGIIPIGEKAFPVTINDIFTDVREGEFVLYGRHNATRYHRSLRMGCGVTRYEANLLGTLGGFVDLPGKKIGCLTAAHVVLTENEMVKYNAMEEQMRMSWNSSLENGNITYYVYQPTIRENINPFGKVRTIALQEGNIFSSSVDAAIIEITDDKRFPNSGCFPDGDFYDEGFTIDSPMMYTTGNILDKIPSSPNPLEVIKFGGATGIRRGFLDWEGTTARVVSEHGKYFFPTMHGQMQIIPNDFFSQNTSEQMDVTPTEFADHGDSGALAFLIPDGDVNDLSAIGMVVGGNSTNCLTLVTPILTIFKALSLPETRFKIFPNVRRTLGEHTVIMNAHSEDIKVLSENVKAMSENIKAMSEDIKAMSENIKSLEEKINQK